MKVKIGNKIYNSEKEPLMIILTESDKENIQSMEATAFKYAEFPMTEEWEDPEVMLRWMKDIPKEVL